MRRTKIIKHRHRGQALIEFAIVLPLLTVLALFIVQYGIIYRTTINLTNLTREGARYAATAPGSNSDIEDRVKAVIPSNINPDDVVINVLPDDESDPARKPGSGGNITVEVEYDMRKKIFLPTTIFGAHIFAETYKTQATFAVQ